MSDPATLGQLATPVSAFQWTESCETMQARVVRCKPDSKLSGVRCLQGTPPQSACLNPSKMQFQDCTSKGRHPNMHGSMPIVDWTRFSQQIYISDWERQRGIKPYSEVRSPKS